MQVHTAAYLIAKYVGTGTRQRDKNNKVSGYRLGRDGLTAYGRTAGFPSLFLRGGFIGA